MKVDTVRMMTMTALMAAAHEHNRVCRKLEDRRGRQMVSER